ncbi:MAG: DinB family protein [Ignavibacteria bacterium]|nr:DinB family protein [Ignavibacteria bacterium]
MITKPSQSEYSPYYHKYVQLVPEGNIIDILINQLVGGEKFFSNIDEEKSLFRYAENKWSIREVLGHIIDTERIFIYRALRFSRNDPQALLSFDENYYAANSNYKSILLAEIWKEFSFLRNSNILMFNGFTDEMWALNGIASGNNVTVRTLPYLLAGHFIHHLNVIKERYL